MASSIVERKEFRVLISGAGIAGLVAAYWLGRAGVSVTVLERAEEIRSSGHIICIRQLAVPIIRHMGIEEEVMRRVSLEKGLKVVDSNNLVWACFPQSDNSFSSGMELDRGELVRVLYEAAKDKATFLLGNWIETIQEKHDCLQVSLANGTLGIMEFDVLLVAEGLSSRTRAKVFNQDVRTPIYSLNQWAASFSYPSEEKWARWYNIINNRCLLVRPDRSGRGRVLAMCRGHEEDDRKMLNSRTATEEQRRYFLQLFKGTGWESAKILQGLSEAKDLYVQELAQVKCETWSKGRSVLVGDTAYCPSPVGGTGTSAAIVGAYILAAELIKNPANHRLAFSSYETNMRPWIQLIQKPAPIAIKIGIPATRFGIRSFHLLLYFICSSPVAALLSLFTTIRRWAGSTSTQVTPFIPPPRIFDLDSSDLVSS